jgi:hypothetical protein
MLKDVVHGRLIKRSIQLIAGIGQSFVVCSGRTLENHKSEHREADFTICLAKLVQFRDCADVRIPGVLHPS